MEAVMPAGMKLEAVTVTAEWAVRRAVVFLVSESAFFAVTPLPDDEWEIAVKPDRVRTLKRFLAELV